MKTMRGFSGFVGGLTALVLLGSASSASAALIHDIFHGTGAPAGFIQFNTENSTDPGAMVTGFQLDLSVPAFDVSFDLSHVDQASATWTIDPNTWALSNGFLRTGFALCSIGGVATVEFGFSSPGSAEPPVSGSVIAGCSGSASALVQQVEALTFAPPEMDRVDEPSALLLLGVGLVGLSLWRRPKRQIGHA